MQITSRTLTYREDVRERRRRKLRGREWKRGKEGWGKRDWGRG